MGGLYASLLGAVNWSDHDLVNTVISSTAKKSATGLSGVAPLGANAALDLRTFASYGNVFGGAFTDSVGIAVSGSKDDVLTLGASLGLDASIGPATLGFIRAGVKWSKLDSSVTAFSHTQTGSVSGMSESAEAGFTTNLGGGATLGLSGFGELTDSSLNYGGRAQIGLKF